MYSKASRVLVTNCTFHGNKNGAVAIFQSQVRIIKSYFLENIAQHGGAAISSEYRGKTEILDTQFRHNKVNYKPTAYLEQSLHVAISGGTVRCRSCNMLIIRSIFEHNKGVALLAYGALITLKSCQFSQNSAAESANSIGGGFYATMRTIVYMFGITTFDNNAAHYGAAFHVFLSVVHISGKLLVANNTANLGAIGIVHSTAIIIANIVFSENIGSLCL